MLRIRDAGTGEPAGVAFVPDLPPSEDDRYMALTFSPDGRWLVLRRQENVYSILIRVHEAATGKPLHLSKAFNQAYFSPDGSRLLTAGGHQAALVWDLKTRRIVGRLDADIITDACFSPDGRRVALAHDNYQLAVWDVERGERLHKPVVESHGARCLTFSPDGRRLAATYGKGVQVWDAATGDALTPPVPLNTFSPGWQLRFMAEGRVLVWASGDWVRLWDAATGEPLGRPIKLDSGFQIRLEGNHAVTLGADGRTLFTRTNCETTGFEIRSLAPAPVPLWTWNCWRRPSPARGSATTATCSRFPPRRCWRCAARRWRAVRSGSAPRCRTRTPCSSPRADSRVPKLAAVARDRQEPIERRIGGAPAIGPAEPGCGNV